MTKISNLKNLILGAAIALGCLPMGAQARGGRASYDAHTSAMVTAARYEARGTMLRVTNPENGRSVVVRVNDRGPFNGGRVLDLSTGAFSQLFGGLGRGVGPIEYEVISGGASQLTSRGITRSQAARRENRGRRHRHRRYHRSRRH